MHADLEDNSARIFNCPRCYRQRIICRSCDRGNRYCSESCAGAARQEGLRRARRRFQQSCSGRDRHRAAQKRYRQRKLALQHRDRETASLCVEVEIAENLQEIASSQDVRTSPADNGQKERSFSSVMDHSSPLAADRGIVLASVAREHQSRVVQENQEKHQLRCDMCSSWCGPFLRRKPWRRGRRETRAKEVINDTNRKGSRDT